MKKNTGFTLIELLVVIAIIGILSSVVLASLNTARAKGADAAIKSNLANMRAQAELVYSDAVPNSYAGVCANAQVSAAETAATTAGGNGGNCYSPVGGASWTAWAGLKADTTKAWCVDNQGASRQVLLSGTSASLTACPVAG